MSSQTALGTQLRGNNNNPYHKSVGAVVLNEKSQVVLIQKPNGLVTLLRETQYSQESPIDCIKRGAKEELGSSIQIGKFLGTLLSYFPRLDGTIIHKSTDYFVARLVNDEPAERESHEENDTLLWLSVNKAKQKLLEQGEVDQGTNEAVIIDRFTSLTE